MSNERGSFTDITKEDIKMKQLGYTQLKDQLVKSAELTAEAKGIEFGREAVNAVKMRT